MPYKDPEKYRAYQKAYREQHNVSLSDYIRAYRLKNLSQLRESDRLRYDAEKKRDYNKAYWLRRRNDWQTPEYKAKRCLKEHRRRVAVRSSASYTVEEWNNLLETTGHRCLCCGRTDVPSTVDHIIPLSKGGINTIENLQPLCKSCNCSKHTKVIDYRGQIAKSK